MAEIEIQPLSDRLSDDEMQELLAALEKAGAPALPRTSDAAELTVADDLDDAVLREMLDRLEPLDAACEIYLPIEIDGRVTAGDLMVGSVQGLLEALAELKDELEFDADEEDDDDHMAESDVELSDLRGLWKLLHAGATEALDRGLPLHIVA